MNILFLGHSLIEFFDWQKRFPAHTVANLGVAGETVEGLLSRIDGIIQHYPSADLIFIMTGANNIAMEDFEFLDPYREIIEKLSSAYPKARIFIHSILPIMLEWISHESIATLNRSLNDMAQQMNIEFINIYDLFVDSRGNPIQECFLDDGVHLGDRGYAVWAGKLEGIINL